MRHEFLTTREIAERLWVSQRTVQRWITTGELPGVRFGPRLYLVRPRDFKRWLERRGLQDSEASPEQPS